jgi:hypothetical protein
MALPIMQLPTTEMRRERSLCPPLFDLTGFILTDGSLHLKH